MYDLIISERFKEINDLLESFGKPSVKTVNSILFNELTDEQLLTLFETFIKRKHAQL